MIDLAMNFIVAELNSVIRDAGDAPGRPAVQIGNISMHESGNDAAGADVANSIVATLVNLEEEKTLKNHSTIVRQGDSVKKIRPVISLNMFILFANSSKNYGLALRQISHVIQFFQTKNVFFSGNTTTLFSDKLDRLIFDLYPMTFEQQNHLWGIMGSKMLPSVVYKVRMVAYQDDLPVDAGIIRRIRNTAEAN